MDISPRFWNWLIFLLSFGAYLPLAIGGWQHPVEINTASYGLWLILALTFLYSSYCQGFAGWRLPLGFALGNSGMLIMAMIRGGTTFNLGPAEYVVLFGLTSIIALWVLVGQLTGKWSPRILFFGSIAVDLLSFYPQAKQYLLPHEPLSLLGFTGWGMWLLAAIVNLVMAEKFFTIWKNSPSKRWQTVESSLLSIEQIIFMIAMILIMAL